MVSTRSQAQAATVFGITKAGAPCKLCLNQGDFCRMHQHQKSVPTATAAASEKVFGMKQDGTPCKTCARLGDFCHLHANQEPTQDEPKQQDHTKPQWGVTKAGVPCKKCLAKQDYCHLHLYQRATVPEAPEQPAFAQQKPSPPEQAPDEPAQSSKETATQTSTIEEEIPFCQHTAKSFQASPISKDAKVEPPCILCIRQGTLCLYHQFQKDPLSVFGVSEACRSCLKIGDFCDHHQDQKKRQEQATTTEIKVYGFTRTNNPCKICLWKDDFCGHHEDQRFRGVTYRKVPSSTLSKQVYGLRRDGKACKLCMRQGKFCHWHKVQDPEYSSSTTDMLSLGVTKDGLSCRLCQAKGGFCHMHQTQATGAAKKGTVSRLIRFCSLLVFGLMVQSLVIVALNEDYREVMRKSLSQVGQITHDKVMPSKVLQQLGVTSYFGEGTDTTVPSFVTFEFDWSRLALREDNETNDQVHVGASFVPVQGLPSSLLGLDWFMGKVPVDKE